MKPRIRAYSKNYTLWINNAWLALRLNIENERKYKLNMDVIIPYTMNPKTGFIKYIKAL